MLSKCMEQIRSRFRIWKPVFFNIRVVTLTGLFLLLIPMNVSAEGFYAPLDTDGELVIVIDPGHGGDNLGADYNGFVEKEMNMVVAKAMRDELEKYQDVTVYMTHEDTSAPDMTLQERADFAEAVHADFLFCLHFNMSPNNQLFGSEVWVSAFDDMNRQGFRFGQIELSTLREMGLAIRGVKTKHNKKGVDYYGILRHCAEYEIPAALIEHCHVDHETDVPFCDSKEELQAFGVADATSVAKFFGLSSELLLVDYSTELESFPVNSNSLYAKEDTTDPDLCMVETAYIDYEKCILGLTLSAYDSDTPMQYYSYSLDGGLTYSPYFSWPESDMIAGYSPDTFTFEVEVPDGTIPSVVVRAYNQYDRLLESNQLSDYQVFASPVVEAGGEDVSSSNSMEEPKKSFSPDFEAYQAPKVQNSVKKMSSLVTFLLLCLAASIFILMVLFFIKLRLHVKRKKRRKKRKS